VHQRPIEFNEKPCEMVFIANRSADLKLFNRKASQIADLETDIKFLRMLREDQVQIVQELPRLTEISAQDRHSQKFLKHVFDSSLNLLCKASDRLDSMVRGYDPISTSVDFFLVSEMLARVRRIVESRPQAKNVIYDETIGNSVPAAMNSDGKRVM
jgi:hypothetical protein